MPRQVAKVEKQLLSTVPEEFLKYAAAAVWLPVEVVKRWVKNPRDNKMAIGPVATSILTFGFVAPICIWTSMQEMVAGHTRLSAYERIVSDDPLFVPRGAPGPGLVPVRFHEFKDAAEAHAYAVADNKLHELSTWDREALQDVFLEFKEERIVFDATGFEFTDYFPLTTQEGESNNPDDVPPLPKVAVTKIGDVWKLGRHVLVCGDSTVDGTLGRIIDGVKIDLLWTDPPYNVAYEGKTSEKLTIQNDSMSDEKFRGFLVSAFGAAAQVMKKGSIFYVAHADSEGFNFRGAVRDVGWKQAQTLIWVKDRFVMGRQDYHWRHEPILYGWKEGSGHLMLKDRTQDTVWEYARPARSEEHPTMKPVALVEKAVINSSAVGGRVLDIFGGSGTTLIACERRERTAYLVEIDPLYCDVIVERWEQLTGQKATRVSG